MCLDRAGLVGPDGPTHHGVFDLAYLRPIPNLVISAPHNEHELRNLMYTAVYGNEGPFVIRYPRGQGELTEWHNEPRLLTIGKGRKLKKGKDMALLSIGTIGNNAAKAITKAEELGISVAHYDMVFLKPIDEDLLREVARKFKQIITVEDGVIKGGLGSAVLEYLAENHFSDIQVHRIGIADEFVTHGSVRELQQLAGIDPEGILSQIVQLYHGLSDGAHSNQNTGTVNPVELIQNVKD